MQKMIRCILGAEQLTAFVERMTGLTNGMTVWETRDEGAEASHTVYYRGVPYQVGGLSVSIDIVSDESWVEDIIRRVSEAHRKEEFSVHFLYVIPIEASYHIRNGFMDL